MEVLMTFIILIAAMIIVTIVDIVLNLLTIRRLDILDEQLENVREKLHINILDIHHINNILTRHIKEEENGKEEKV